MGSGGDNPDPNSQMSSAWRIPKREKVHGYYPTQKPLRVVRRALLAPTLEGDLILHPFCGSGTTGVAAKELSRFFAGAEFEEEFAFTHRYCSLAINRATGRAFSPEPPPRAKAEANACRLW